MSQKLAFPADLTACPILTGPLRKSPEQTPFLFAHAIKPKVIGSEVLICHPFGAEPFTSEGVSGKGVSIQGFT